MTIEVQNIRLKKIVFESVKSQLPVPATVTVFVLPLNATLDTQQNDWNIAGSPKDHLASKIVCIHISSILRQKRMGIFKFCTKFEFRTVELRFVCNNQAIQ